MQITKTAPPISDDQKAKTIIVGMISSALWEALPDSAPYTTQFARQIQTVSDAKKRVEAAKAELRAAEKALPDAEKAEKDAVNAAILKNWRPAEIIKAANERSQGYWERWFANECSLGELQSATEPKCEVCGGPHASHLCHGPSPAVKSEASK